MTYKVYFALDGIAQTGLTLAWEYLKKVSDGLDYGSPPSFTEVGGGWYKFDLTPTEDLVGSIDGSATITNDTDRYVPVDLTPNDDYLDAKVSLCALEATSQLIKTETESHPTLAEIEAGDMALLSLEATSQSILAQVNTLNPLGFAEGAGTLTATGAEDILYENATPSAEWVPDSVHIDLTNMVASDVTTVRVYAKMKSGGAYVQFDEQQYSDEQTIKAIQIQGIPNRYGYKVTLEQTSGAYRDYDWERFNVE